MFLQRTEAQNMRNVARAIRKFLNRLNFSDRFIDLAIQTEIKEAEWDPALLKPPLPVVHAEHAQNYTKHVDFLKGLLPQIGTHLSLLWQELTDVGAIVPDGRVNVLRCIPGTLGATISDDLTATLQRAGTASFEPVKTLVNLLRHIKALER
jgi:hypothetical protein